jgi:hypothetical protein
LSNQSLPRVGAISSSELMLLMLEHFCLSREEVVRRDDAGRIFVQVRTALQQYECEGWGEEQSREAPRPPDRVLETWCLHETPTVTGFTLAVVDVWGMCPPAPGPHQNANRMPAVNVRARG